MSNLLDEAARLADLVACGQLTSEVAEAMFWSYIEDNGLTVTRAGAQVLLDPEYTPRSGKTHPAAPLSSSACPNKCADRD